MSKVRIADIPDMKSIVELGYELLEKSTSNGIKVDESKFKMLVAGMIGSKKGIVYVVVDDNDVPQGFLLGMIDELFYSPQRFATDLATYVREEYRHLAPRMYKKFIAWAKSKPKVVEITLGISSGIGDTERVGKLYEKLGFSRMGGLYMTQVKKHD